MNDFKMHPFWFEEIERSYESSSDIEEDIKKLSNSRMTDSWYDGYLFSTGNQYSNEETKINQISSIEFPNSPI
jgi:hypothetical protein